MQLSRSVFRGFATAACRSNLLRPRSSVLLIRSSALRFSTSPAMKSNSNVISKRFDSILKSQEDSREYRGLELSNGLRVLLVSDPTTDKSAAAMDVNVGHLMDSWDLPGTAHFAEHMLFLGTAKYPEENEYSKFITSNAGMSNAFTASNHTNYHFDVKPDQLQGALDRFVQFFLTPQFTESATEREVCAVDSEHSNNLKNDGWRNMQVDRHMSKPGHDYGKFGTGNKKTLMEDARTKGIEPRKALLEFHKQWYSSNIMCLCIVGKESLDELEHLVTSLDFGAIENKSVERKQWLDHPYQGESLGKRIEVVPVKDTRSLKLVFPMPDLSMEYKSQPAHYFSHLIGHEAKGSLLSELKRRGWVSSLSSGHHSPASGFGVFEIKVDLSPEGLEHTEEIVALIFAYIGMLRKVGVQRWIHDELQLESATKFRFQDKQTPLTLAQTAAEELQYIPMNDILSSRYLIEEFKSDRITELLNMLTPQNFYYRVVAQKFAGQEGNTHEPVYGTEMKISKIETNSITKFQEAMENGHPSFHLPEKNTFIATKFDLKPREEKNSPVPELLCDTDYLRLWFLQDDEYKLPKAVTKISITTPMVAHDPKTTLLSNLWIWCFTDDLAEDTYNAELAGLRQSISMHRFGTFIKVNGYDEKMPEFTKFLANRMTNYKIDRVRFDVLFEMLKRTLRNHAHNQPYNLSQHYLHLLIDEKYWSKEQLLAVCEGITPEEVEKFGNEMFKAFHMEMLVHGNVTKEEAHTLAADVASILKSANKSTVRPLFRNEFQPAREVALSNGDEYIYRHYQNTHDVGCVDMIYQFGIQNMHENALAELMVQLMKETAFNTLRTNEQLGYIIWTSSRMHNGTLGLDVIVQGPKDPDHVLSRIENFIETFQAKLTSMSEAEFNEQREALICRLLEKPKTLNKRNNRIWNEIDCQQYDFERNEDEAAFLKTITKDQVLDYYNRKLVKGAQERRVVACLVHPKGNDEAMTRKKREAKEENCHSRQEIENVEDLRSMLPLFGRPKPKIQLRQIGADIFCKGDKCEQNANLESRKAENDVRAKY